MALNRVVNDPALVVEDMLRGWLAAHPDSLAARPDNPRVIQRKRAPERGKVGVISGGGSGHEPAFLGYVGQGLLDAVAVGEIFSSPSARNFLDAMQSANGGAGVACLYGNYAGDNMNVKMAMEMAARQGIAVKTVVANDDVPSAPLAEAHRRRGVAGEVFMWKIAAAKASMGGSLDEVIAIAQKAMDATRSMGIGLSACVIPAVGKANFTIAPGTMEVGIGHHGEPGIAVRQVCSASEMAERMLNTLLPELPFQPVEPPDPGERVAVLLSGLGATPLMEQYILYGEVERRLQALGLRVVFARVGNLFTSLEMMGVTLTLMRLDDALQACLQHPCQSVGLNVAATEAHTPESTAPASAAPPAPNGNTIHTAKATSTAARPDSGNPTAPQNQRPMSGPSVELATAGSLVRELISTIVAHRDYLSEIDGLIGDGDHGINMAKGFTRCATRLGTLGHRADDLSIALLQLSEALMDDIGGSMGPLYGNFFMGFVNQLQGYRQMDAALFSDALNSAVQNVQSMGQAQVGDKTLIDTLVPARAAFQSALQRGQDFAAALQAMSEAAEQGKNSTKDMQARIGRSARLGPRSIGVLDAGATSCCLLLQAMAHALQGQLREAKT